MPLAAARGKRAFLCAGCLLAVEKVGKLWDAVEGEAKEVEENESVIREVGVIGDENMGNGSMELARE
jgi:hypothetical protein